MGITATSGNDKMDNFTSAMLVMITLAIGGMALLWKPIDKLVKWIMTWKYKK